MERLQSTQHGARALRARMLRPLPRGSECNGAPARATRESAAKRGGRSLQVTPRSCIGEKRSLAGAAPFHSVRSDHSPRGTAHAHCKCACCAFSRETASAVARPRVPPERRLRKEEAAARTSHHGLALVTRGLSLMQRPSLAYGATKIHAAWRRARTARAHDAPPLERQRAQWRARACQTRNPSDYRGRTRHVAPRQRADGEGRSPV
jgi:hypothetical protein